MKNLYNNIFNKKEYDDFDRYVNNSHLYTKYEFNKNKKNKKNILFRYGSDLTALAKEGMLSYEFGCEKELAELMEILARRFRNNPVLIGPPGLDKSAIIELFVSRILTKKVPLIFQNRKIYSLDTAKLMAGAVYRQQFEMRFYSVIMEIVKNKEFILFIDEIHNIVEAGGGGENAAINLAHLIKSALAISGFQCIGATTENQYKKIEDDARLNRRFQSIRINEPSPENTFKIITCIKPVLEAFHNVQILPETIRCAIKLSSRYIQNRYLPDKAIDLVDRVCAKEVIKLTNPSENSIYFSLINNILKNLAYFRFDSYSKKDVVYFFLYSEIEKAFEHLLAHWIKNPSKIPKNIKNVKNEKLSPISKELFTDIKLLLIKYVDNFLFTSYNCEKKIKEEENFELKQFRSVEAILRELKPIFRNVLFESFDGIPSNHLSQNEIDTLYNSLRYFSTSTGRQAFSEIDNMYTIKFSKNGYNKSLIKAEDIEMLVSEITGIPVGSISDQDAKVLNNLESTLHSRVIGQKGAVTAVAKSIRRARLGIQNPNRPIGSFFFCGPTGVGKTEVAKALAVVMFGSEKEMIRFDMSEFMEKFTVSRLIGSPPGYIGSEEGGQLTEAVVNKPYSLVLFDEIEKAHPDVMNIFLQILEDGHLSDNKKKLVSFKNTIIIMTSNAAAQDIQHIALKYQKQEESILNKISQLKEKSISRNFDSSISNIHTNQELTRKQLYVVKKEYENFKKEKVKKLNLAAFEYLSRIFLPEFLNRLDDIVVFEPLAKEDILTLSKLMVKDIINRVKELGLTLIINEHVYYKLTEEGYNPAFGARPLRRLLTRNIEDLIAEILLLEENMNKNLEFTIALNDKQEIIAINNINKNIIQI
jgi:ATP-dependent Clp protease ATP-binding subunit ClpB